MKSNKTLKYTGIIQGVLITTLLLLAIWIQVTFLYNTYYCEDSSFWAIHGDYPILFIFNTLFQPLHLSEELCIRPCQSHSTHRHTLQ